MAASRGIDLTVSEAWSVAYPGACVGVLWMTGVLNPDHDHALDALLDETAAALRPALRVPNEPTFWPCPSSRPTLPTTAALTRPTTCCCSSNR